MRACIQRVANARVEVATEMVGQIGAGLLVLLGVARGDTLKDTEFMADKTIGLRIFEDDDGKMNRSVEEIGGEVLIVSQFTLLGDCRKGRRPSFVQAAEPELGKALYEHFVEHLRRKNIVVATGEFQANMQVHLVNDGPVTLFLDSHKNF